MLRITIDLLPHGDVSRREKLGEIHIINDATGTHEIGNYITRLYTKHKKPRILKTGSVKDFPRLKLGVYELLHLALRNIFE